MGTAKRQRKKQNREMGRQAAETAARRQASIRRTIRIVAVVAVLIGLFFLIYDHIQLQRHHKGAPPPPLWKRAYRWIRDAVNPDEEQAGA